MPDDLCTFVDRLARDHAPRRAVVERARGRIEPRKPGVVVARRDRARDRVCHRAARGGGARLRRRVRGRRPRARAGVRSMRSKHACRVAETIRAHATRCASHDSRELLVPGRGATERRRTLEHLARAKAGEADRIVSNIADEAARATDLCDSATASCTWNCSCSCCSPSAVTRRASSMRSATSMPKRTNDRPRSPRRSPSRYAPSASYARRRSCSRCSKRKRRVATSQRSRFMAHGAPRVHRRRGPPRGASPKILAQPGHTRRSCRARRENASPRSAPLPPSTMNPSASSRPVASPRASSTSASVRRSRSDVAYRRRSSSSRSTSPS